MDIIYRNADLTDLEEICDLVSRAKENMIEHDILQWDEFYPVEEDFRWDIEKRQLYVGLLEEQIAVICVLNQEYDAEYEEGDWKYTDGPFYVIHRLCVNPAFQNRGIAGHTLLHMEEELKKRGVCSIRLDVFSQNPFALKLYQSLGYCRVGCVDWRKGRFYLMEKQI